MNSLLSSATVATLVGGLALSLTACVPVNTEASSPAPTPSATASNTGSVDEQLDSYWDYVANGVGGAERPDVEVVRLVDPFEWTEVQAQCMRDEGFPDVVVMPDGGIKPGGMGVDQESAYLLSRYVCTAKHPIDPKYTAPLTEEQISDVYEYFLQELVPCLEGNGYSVPEPPSGEVFAETFASDRWSPYAEVFGADPSISIDEYYRISVECPQWPTNFFG